MKRPLLKLWFRRFSNKQFDYVISSSLDDAKQQPKPAHTTVVETRLKYNHFSSLSNEKG